MHYYSFYYTEILEGSINFSSNCHTLHTIYTSIFHFIGSIYILLHFFPLIFCSLIAKSIESGYEVSIVQKHTLIALCFLFIHTSAPYSFKIAVCLFLLLHAALADEHLFL
ncbi:uncharacterized protein NESG_01855 [Nematocida ausubeli]|uniref:Uncharacterized protein n=1 Tax=Nematocida ausubeli (strain ATCC PRA-371 / ERTm2) TaxID=1913371 RepID=A0A086J149_NEMA1|nr:uncharacterized protein NESG_01855 [Nematocida ausubeli]KFG25867.1 hypothetical protein NESG_01855 [Nematocida ausubeli]